MNLTQKTRRVIFALFVVAFILVAPTILFYTAGYRYNWKQKRLEQTGVLSIDATPSDARIFLNGVRIKKNLPIRLANRNPGTYELNIERDGYKPWRKDVVIESKRSTYIKNISLFRESLPILLLKDGERAIHSMVPAPSGEALAVLWVTDGVYDIELLNAKTEESVLLGRYSTKSPPRVHWSPFNAVGVIETADMNGATFQFFDVTGATFRTYAFPSRGSRDAIQWVKNPFTPSIAVAEDNILRLLTAKTITQIAKISSDVVWYVEESGAVWLNDPERHALFPKETPEAAISYPSTADLQSIVDMNDDRLLLATNQGLIIRRLRPLAEQTIPASQYLYRASTKEWLAWSPWELWAAYDDGSTALLNRTSEETRWVFPMDKYGVLLLATQNALFAFNPGYYVSHELFRNGAIETISADMETKRIYFLGTVGNKRGIYTLAF